MKVIAMHGFGSVDTFRLEERPIPVPKENEVRIRSKAVGFNPVDWKIRQNWYGGDPNQVMGSDCSGIIDKLGPHADKFSLGDEVLAMVFRSSNGSYAEYCCVPEELVVKKPENLTFAEAAVMPLASQTAYRATLAVNAVKKGDNVFIAGAGGGVGSFACQFIKFAECNAIYTLAKDEKSLKHLQNHLGLNPKHILLYPKLAVDELKEKLIQMNDGNLFQATFDFVGKDMKRLALELTDFSGHFSTIVPEENFQFPFWGENDIPRARNLSVHQVAIAAELGSNNKEKLKIYEHHLNKIMQFVRSCEMHPPIIQVVGSFSAETVKKAHLLLESGGVLGKLCMVLD